MIRYTVKHIERTRNVRVYADKRRAYTFPSRRTTRTITPLKLKPEPKSLADLTQDLLEVCNAFRFMDIEWENEESFTILVYHHQETGARKSNLIGLIRVILNRDGSDLEYRQLVLLSIGTLKDVKDEYFREYRGIQYPEEKLMPEGDFNVYRAQTHREPYPTYINPVFYSLYDKESKSVTREESQLYPTQRTSHYGYADTFKESKELVKKHPTYESRFE